MTEVILNRVAVGKIDLNVFKKWLSESYHDKLCENYQFSCTRTEFITYFLNFVHEEISGLNKCDSPQKNYTSKENNIGRKVPILHSADINKSFLPMVNRSLEKSFDEVSIEDSTPKAQKIHTESSHYHSYLSPISPLHKNSNCYSPSKKNKSEKLVPLCLGDFLTQKKSLKKKVNRIKNESSRRITPICVNEATSNNSFRKLSNSFTNFNTSELDAENTSHDMLLEERMKILAKKACIKNPQLLSKNKTSYVKEVIEIEPDINNVTYKTELNNIVDVYITILNNNFVLNIASEIYFLISLLLLKYFNYEDTDKYSADEFYDSIGEDNESKEKDINCSHFFESIHNIVYFASKCLESEVEILKYLDKSTLKFLSFDKRLKVFAPSLVEKVTNIADGKCERIIEILDDNIEANVCFNSDTDNRNNFPNDTTFNAFRKQRDMFYEILRIWEHNHLQPDWSFSIGLTAKIRSLFSIQNEPVNFMHFARLFKAQLLTTCGKSQKETGLSEDQTSFLSSLPNIDTEKLNRLKNRLVTKQSSSGLNSVPSFGGYQEFYRDFITAAANQIFNTYLNDILITEIMELNDSKFISSDLEDSADGLTASTRKAYLLHVGCLRLLAKFLGFITSLPYKSECKEYPDGLLATQVKIRQQTKPSFDVKHILLESVQQGTLVITIPWITIYLSMLDFVTLRLPYYTSVHHILFRLYRNSRGHSINDMRYKVPLIQFSLGWLFELPHFPDQEYFNFLRNDIQEMDIINKLTLDDMDLVDQNFLYICCPYLEEIKKLLMSNVQNNGITVKHITPITAVQSSEGMAKKRIEIHLEEAFFHGQPSSVRKTVEFVSERVASACIKHICYSVIPDFKAKAIVDLRNFLDNWSKNCQMLSPVKRPPKAALRAKISQITQSNVVSLKEECGKIVSNILKEKISASIEGLLAIESLTETKTVCVSIASKMSKERMKQWMMTHLTTSLFTKDFEIELQRILNLEERKRDKPIFTLPPGGKVKTHDENCLSGFHILERIKLLSTDVLSTPESVNKELVTTVIKEASKTIEKRCDVNDTVISFVCTSLVDLSLLLLTHRSDILPNDELTLLLIKVWQHYYGKVEDLFKNILCSRNVMLLAQSGDARQSWNNLAKFTAFLVKEKIITPEMFESQCTGFFKRDWDQGTLQNISLFFQKFIEFYIQYGGNVDKFTLLLEYLSEFCTDF